jgi:hypothetical protein
MDLVTTSCCLCGAVLSATCLGLFGRLRPRPSKVHYWLWRVAQEVKEVAFSHMRRHQDVILFQSFDGFNSMGFPI